jgi:DNA modification methylase
MTSKLILGDCQEKLKELEDNSIDLILTDPPWMVSQEIKIHRSMNPKKYKYVGKDINLDFGEWDKFKDEKEYWNLIQTTFRECIRILKPRGHFITFFDQNKVSHLIDFVVKEGMLMRQHLYWLKSNPVPRARKVDFMVALEAAVWFTKETKSKATFNYQLGQQHNYIKAGIVPKYSEKNGKRIHPTQKPLKVAKVWIKYLTNEGDIILDPFMGSGWACIAAKQLNRKYIGIEAEEKYYNHAKKRLDNIPSTLGEILNGIDKY